MINTPKRAARFGSVAVVTLCLGCPFEPVDHCCSTNTGCDDGLFCTAVETCDGCACQAGTPPCGTTAENCPNCDESLDACVDPCVEDADCDDFLFCNGLETCDECSCHAGTPPCGDPLSACSSCDEELDVCIVPECTVDADCSDGLFCNGPESCSSMCVCAVGIPPCEEGFVCIEEYERCVDPAICSWCDEETGICVDGCVADTDCDDGLFCNGVESCESCSCHAGTLPCQNDCDEEQDDCSAECVDDGDCFDDNLCTSDECSNGACSNCPRDCSCNPGSDWCVEDAQCNPATGLCELPDGSDPCVSYCWHSECIEPDIDQIDQMDGFDATLEEWQGWVAGCPSRDQCVDLVVGTCNDGSIFLYFFRGLNGLVHYFEPDTGAFVGMIYWVDALDAVCCGITYWPHPIECEDAIVLEVFAGGSFEVGDPITLPEPHLGPCFCF